MAVTTGDYARDSQTRTHVLGTFCGNIAACAAGLAQLEYLRDHQEEVYRTTFAMADRFAAHLEVLRDELGYPNVVRRYESLVKPLFGAMSNDNFVALGHPQRNVVAEYMWTYYLRRRVPTSRSFATRSSHIRAYRRRNGRRVRGGDAIARGSAERRILLSSAV